MPNLLSEFDAVSGTMNVFSATNGRLRCTALVLRTGGLCLHSPVSGLHEAARSSLSRLGEVEYLLAPNHYHNKGLGEYSEHFPDAKLIASEFSRPRLQKQTGLDFEGLDALTRELPDGMRIVTPEGLKTGEIWIVAGVGLIVVDAFAGPLGPNKAPHLLGTFPKYGVGNQGAYGRWTRDFIKTERPQILIPCHGGIVDDPNLSAKLTELVDKGI